jgi:transposase
MKPGQRLQPIREVCGLFGSNEMEGCPVTTRYYVGFDVHKKTIVICVLDREGSVVQEQTIEAKREALLEWVAERRRPAAVRIALEASGSSAWVTYVLLAEGFDVTPVHPNHVRAIAETKRKSDRLDARKLAELLRAGVLRPVHVPSEEDRATRSLLRQMRRLVSAKTRAKNTVTSLLAELGRVPPWSDVFGKRGRAWLRGLELAPEHRVIVDQQLAQIDLLETQLRDLDKCLENALGSSPLFELLKTIPGVGPRLGSAIALEFGDIRRFKTPKAAACYTGLIPSTYCVTALP